MQSFIKHILIFALLFFFQIYILDRIQIDNVLFRGVHFFGFLYFIISLPNLSRWFLLLIAFFSGFILDLFYQTFGIFSFSLVMVAMLKNPLLDFVFKPDNDVITIPSITFLGINKYFRFVGIISILFHICVISLGLFSNQNLFYALLKIGINGLFSILFCILMDLLSFYKTFNVSRK